MRESIAEGTMLNQLAEKAIQQPVQDELLAYCPTMDLIALATSEERVYVYRLNGQRVLGLGNKNEKLAVQRLRWKPNGQLLAVAWGDNTIRLINADSGKLIHQVDVAAKDGTNVTCLGWGVNFTNSQEAQARIDASENTLDDLLGHTLRAHVPGAAPDLPRELALLDVESTLPKLSPLPSGGKDDDVFSTRASIDAIFHPLKAKDNDAVDVLVAGSGDGFIHLNVYDSFEIGALDLSKASAQLHSSKPLLHASHPFSSTHALLATSASGSSRDLFFIPLDLRFISSSGVYLSVLASKSTTLQNVLRYIGQVQRIMQVEWKGAQDLPNKFLRNINETLQETCHCDFIIAAYHLVVTGDCYAPMKEWLVDELSERGHKRWDKAVTSGYENIRRLAHENLLPALERCSVVVSRLRGLSIYQESNATLGLSTQELNNVFDVLGCLTLLAHNVIKYVGAELEQFRAFSAWLRHEIDTHAADASSSADDPSEKDPIIEHAKVLDYIRGAMTKSRLAAVFPPSNVQDLAGDGKLDEDGPLLYEGFKKEMAKYNSGPPTGTKMPGLESLEKHLERQCGAVFEQIAEAQKRNILFGRPIPLGSGFGEKPRMDMRVVFEDDLCVSYVAIRSDKDLADLHVFRISMHVENGVSSLREAACSRLRLGTGEIEDAKFVDDDILMVLWAGQDGARLLSIPYRPESESPYNLPYAPWSETSKSSKESRGAAVQSDKVTRLSDEDVSVQYSSHAFPPGPFRPKMLEINGRKGRRVVCVVGNEGLYYQIFDLDSTPEEPDEPDEPDEAGHEASHEAGMDHDLEMSQD